jgi:hypothetical protein
LPSTAEVKKFLIGWFITLYKKIHYIGQRDEFAIISAVVMATGCRIILQEAEDEVENS